MRFVKLTHVPTPSYARQFAEFFYQKYRIAGLKRLRQDKISYWRELRTFKYRNHTLQPFDRHRCIFVHVPKTAGLSVSEALFDTATGGHRTVTEYRKIFGEPTFRSYFKFAFVRNPWDRVVSSYYFFKSGGRTGFHRWADNHLSHCNSFQAFVKTVGNLEDLGRHKHLMPQYAFLYDETDTLAVDFLGRFEDLERGFNHIRRRLNGVGSDLKHLNASKRRDYRAYYTDETRAIIAKAYHKDIELFGYEFEGRRSYQEGNRFNELSE